MISDLIDAHAQVERQLELAISQNVDAEAIRTMDTRLSELELQIRAAVPANDDQARVKLEFFLSRIAFDGGNVVNTEDIGTIEQIFQQILDRKKSIALEQPKPGDNTQEYFDDT